MKTIKELKAEHQEACECDEVDTSSYRLVRELKIDTLKDVLELIEEWIGESCMVTDEYVEELKKRITG